MEEFDAWEKSIEEKEDYNLTFEELKEKVQRFIEEENTDDEKEN
ncbi:hypothetical protein [Sinobaca sp. H24]|nr:hypothetical protein [Sinobaca sp. H24]